MDGVEREIDETGQRKIFTCGACNVKASSYQRFQVHLNGRKHKARTQPKEKFHCDICDVDGNSPIQLKIHLEGKKHMYNLRRKERVTTFSILIFLYYLYIAVVVGLLLLTSSKWFSPWNVLGCICRLFLQSITFLIYWNCYLKWFYYLLVVYWLLKPK